MNLSNLAAEGKNVVLPLQELLYTTSSTLERAQRPCMKVKKIQHTAMLLKKYVQYLISSS